MFYVCDTVHTSHAETAGEPATADLIVGPRAVQQPFGGDPPGVSGEFGVVDARGRCRTSSCQSALNELERRGQVAFPKPSTPVHQGGRVRGLEQPASAMPPRGGTD